MKAIPTEFYSSTHSHIALPYNQIITEILTLCQHRLLPKRGTARTVPKFLCCSVYCVFCVVFCVCFVRVNVYCTTATGR